jgi:hypothetical protein
MMPKQNERLSISLPAVFLFIACITPSDKIEQEISPEMREYTFL